MSLSRWLFGYGSPYTLALLRIVFGAITTLSLLMLVPLAPTFFSENGLLPPPQLEQWQFRITVLHLIKYANAWQATPYVAVLAAAALCFTFGWKSRIMGVLLAIGLVALQNRNALILNSGDGLLRVVL